MGFGGSKPLVANECFFEHEALASDGKTKVNLLDYKGKVMLVCNVASG